MRKVVTIDGASGVGKGTLCQQLAKKLDWAYLDSGALYRVVALHLIKNNAENSNAQTICANIAQLNIEFTQQPQQILLDGVVLGKELRTQQCSELASIIASYPLVRRALLDFQRQFANPRNLIADGRDMGTQIFPNATLKFYLHASLQIRAERRYKQLKEQGECVSLANLTREVAKRDERDQNRAISPLKTAEDAVIINSDNLSAAEVFQLVYERIEAVLLT